MAKGGFPGMGGNMLQLRKQAQKRQEYMARLQDEIGHREFSVSAGGGAVTVVIYGRKELKSIEISPECVDPDDIEMLQDLIISAVNEAIRVADETMNGEMGKLTGSVNLGI